MGIARQQRLASHNHQLAQPLLLGPYPGVEIGARVWRKPLKKISPVEHQRLVELDYRIYAEPRLIRERRSCSSQRGLDHNLAVLLQLDRIEPARLLRIEGDRRARRQEIGTELLAQGGQEQAEVGPRAIGRQVIP